LLLLQLLLLLFLQQQQQLLLQLLLMPPQIPPLLQRRLWRLLLESQVQALNWTTMGSLSRVRILRGAWPWLLERR
jgi:hypothetical protein